MTALIRLASLLAATLFAAATAHAQLFRAYLSIGGNDASPCTVQQPCRLLPRALNVVADGGEIWMLDSANYNTAPVAVNKSVTILAVPGVVGSVVAAGGGPAISINNAEAKVTLRNLVIVPLMGSTWTHGVEFISGKSLVVDRCTVTGALQYGVRVYSAVAGDVLIQDSRILGVTVAVGLWGLNGARISATVLNTVIRDSNFGVISEGGLDLTVTNAHFSGRGTSLAGDGLSFRKSGSNGHIAAHITNSSITNFSVGVYATQISPYSSVSLANSEVSHTTIALFVRDGSSIALGGNRIVHNANAVLTDAGGVVYTSGTNYFAYNGSDGAALVGPGGMK